VLRGSSVPSLCPRWRFISLQLPPRKMVQIVRLGPGGAGPAITKQPPPAPRAGAGITAVAVPGRGQQASGAGAAGRGPPSPTSSIPPPPSRPPPQTEIGILADDCTAVAERWSDHNGALKFFRDRVLKGEIWRKLLTTDERVLRVVHDNKQNYSFGEECTWDWRSFVAGMGKEQRDKLFEGHRIIAVAVERRAGCPDHNMCVAAKTFGWIDAGNSWTSRFAVVTAGRCSSIRIGRRSVVASSG
jgi:hypothetical protein